MERRAFRAGSKRRSTPCRPAPSGRRGAPRLSWRRLGGSATASALRMGASSLPSSRPTCRGKTPRRRATFVRASASRSWTWSSRRASAFRPSPTSTRTRQLSPLCCQRTAAPRCQRKFVEKLARKSCVASSLLVVLVVPEPPDAGLVPSLWSAVEPLVHAPETVQSARIGGIAVVNGAFHERERAHARPFARVCKRIGSACGCQFDDDWRWSCCFIHRMAATLVVVFDGSRTLLLLVERERPGKSPSHSALVGLQLCERRQRHHRKCDVVVRQVDGDSVEPVRDRRAGGASSLEVGPEHEVVNEELRAPSEKVRQRSTPFIGLESVLFVDPNPGQLLTSSRKLVAAPRMFLLRLKQLEPRCHPFVTCPCGVSGYLFLCFKFRHRLVSFCFSHPSGVFWRSISPGNNLLVFGDEIG